MNAQQLRAAIDTVKAEIEPLIEKRDKLQLKLAKIQIACSHESAVQIGPAIGCNRAGSKPYRFKCPECLKVFVK